MALDGACLHHLQKEIWDRAKEARIDKIYQPNRDELVFVLRTRKERMNLLLSARANSARVHFTQVLPENPAQPPMFCMLLRKRFTGGRLLRIEQPGLERLLVFVFDTVNELGDHVEMRLVAEVMGRYSNVILVDPEGKIVDSLRRVDADMSSERWILPGLAYRLPPPQDKLCLLDTEPEAVLAHMDALPR
ncbi:MAG: NFACT family protein, partial [Acutalibacteraceae bacterium]